MGANRYRLDPKRHGKANVPQLYSPTLPCCSFIVIGTVWDSIGCDMGSEAVQRERPTLVTGTGVVTLTISGGPMRLLIRTNPEQKNKKHPGVNQAMQPLQCYNWKHWIPDMCTDFPA